MPIELLPTLFLYIFSVGYTPGPANIFSLSCSIRYGWKESMKMWYGLLTGFCITASTVALICWSAESAVEAYIPWIKYIGAAYILYLAWTIFMSKNDAKAEDRSCTFRSGLIVQLTNAKMIVFEFMTMGMFVMPYTTRLSDYLLFVFPLILAGPGGNFAWLLAGGFLSRLFHRHRRQVDIVLALALVVCAVMILL